MCGHVTGTRRAARGTRLGAFFAPIAFHLVAMDAALLVRVVVVALAPWALVQAVLRLWLDPPPLRRRHSRRASLSVLRDSGGRLSTWTADVSRTFPHRPLLPVAASLGQSVENNSSVPLLPLARAGIVGGGSSDSPTPTLAVRARHNNFRGTLDPASTVASVRPSRDTPSPPKTSVHLTWKSIHVESTLLGAWFAHWGWSLDPMSRLARTLHKAMTIAATVSLAWSAATCVALAIYAWPAVWQLLQGLLTLQEAGRTAPAELPAIDPEDAFAKRSLPMPQPEAEAAGGMHLVPLIPGLTIPFSHTILLLVTLLGAQLVHEVGGHALAALSVHLDRRAERSEEYDATGDDECLPYALGVWIPIPAWLVAAFVVFPTKIFNGGKNSRLSLGHKLRILSAGVAANLVSFLLFIALVGIPGSFAPRPGASIVPHSLLNVAHTTRKSLHLPGGPDGGVAALLRIVGWGNDPISSALSHLSAEDDTRKCEVTVPCNAKGGLRVVKVDPGSALAAAAPVVGVGSILLSVEYTDFYSSDRPPSPRSRLEAYAQSVFSTADDRGWCIASSVWEPDPDHKPLDVHSGTGMTGIPAEDLYAPPISEGKTSDGSSDLFAPDLVHSSAPSLLVNCSPDQAIQGSDVCFRDQQGRMRALNALALVGGQEPFQDFGGKTCGLSDSCTGGSECIFPTVPLVRLRFLVPGESGQGLPSQTLLLAGAPEDALSGTTVSPFVPRKWMRAIPIPHATFDGWLMLLELGAGYMVLTSLSLALLNALPLPGLDGSTIARVILLSIAQRWAASKSERREWDMETIEEALPAQNPSTRRLAQAHRLVAAAHRTVQSLTFIGLLALLSQ